jgi:hypothetical protein
MNCSTSLCPPTAAMMILQVATDESHREPASLPILSGEIALGELTRRGQEGALPLGGLTGEIQNVRSRKFPILRLSPPPPRGVFADARISATCHCRAAASPGRRPTEACDGGLGLGRPIPMAREGGSRRRAAPRIPARIYGGPRAGLAQIHGAPSRPLARRLAQPPALEPRAAQAAGPGCFFGSVTGSRSDVN